MSIKLTKDSVQLLNNIFAYGQVHKPLISVSDSGKLDLYWKIDNFILDLGNNGNEDGFYSYYCKLADGDEITEDEVSIDSVLPDSILYSILID